MDDLMTDCDVYLIVDSEGNHAVGVDLESAKQAYTDTIQDFDQCEGWRLITLSVKAAKPVPVELHGEAPGNGVATMTIKG